jgi:hypothetical protein
MPRLLALSNGKKQSVSVMTDLIQQLLFQSEPKHMQLNFLLGDMLLGSVAINKIVLLPAFA